MPWNNYQGFRVYAKTVKYTNIIAFNIIIQSKFPPKMDFLYYLILIPLNKLISDDFYFYFMALNTPYSPPQNGHKSNLFPWHKSILCWRCFQDFTVI